MLCGSLTVVNPGLLRALRTPGTTRQRESVLLTALDAPLERFHQVSASPGVFPLIFPAAVRVFMSHL
jgi:hypothetical protein